MQLLNMKAQRIPASRLFCEVLLALFCVSVCMSMLIRECRGAGWGESGFFKLARNVEDKQGMCGIAKVMLPASRSQDTMMFEDTLPHIMLYCIALSPGGWLKVTSGRLTPAVGCLSLVAH